MSELYLEHRTDRIERLLSILREGIKPSTETGIVEHYKIGAVCFSAKPERDLGELYDLWGSKSVVLNPEYVRQNADQFRHHDYLHDEDFVQFVKELGIECLGADDPFVSTSPRQIVSVQPIPIEGIARVIVPDWSLERHRGELLAAKPKYIDLYVRRQHDVVKFKEE